MKNQLLLFIFCWLILCSGYEVSGQKKSRYFQIPGRVKMDKGDPSGTTVEVFNIETDASEKKLAVSSSGKFDLELSYQKEYKIAVSKAGYYTKDILISTIVPSGVWKKDSLFPPYIIVVSLFQKVPDKTLSFEGKPVGKISYSPDGRLDNFDSRVFINDKDIKQEIEVALKEAGDGGINKLLAAALESEKKNDLQTAYQLYSEALKLKPGDKFLKEKIKDLDSKLKVIENQKKIQAEFDRLMALGNADMEQKNYQSAILNFRNASGVKPDERLVKTKISEAEGLLAAVNIQRSKTEEEFKRLVAQGDEFVSKKMYADAISDYNGALKIKPNDPSVGSKISAAEKLSAIEKEAKGKIEEQFRQFIASGEKNLGEKKYSDAVNDFKAGLNLKPGDVQVINKLESVQQLIKQLDSEKAKTDQEFNRFVASGDDQVSRQLYPEAISFYNSALKVKPMDPIAASRLASAEKLLISANAVKVKNEEEFRQAMDQGAKNILARNFPQAINDFKKALVLKAGDNLAKEKLSVAEGLLAKANENSRKEDEFNQLLSSGDNASGKNLFSEALDYYKKALIIKPDDSKARAKMSAAEKSLAKIVAAQGEKKAAESNSYTDNIRNGDENYARSQWAIARVYYVRALKDKPEDPYSIKKVESCDKMINDHVTAEKLKEYQDLIAKANTEFQAKNYISARFYYRNSLEILPWENLPQEKLREIDRFFSEKLSQSDRVLYKENQEKADKAFDKKEYAVARFYYNKANEINQNEYNLSRLKQIEKIVSGSEKSKDESDYNDFLNKANEAYNQKNISLARYYYQKALVLKPDEAFLKEQLKKLDVLK